MFRPNTADLLIFEIADKADEVELFNAEAERPGQE